MLGDMYRADYGRDNLDRSSDRWNDSHRNSPALNHPEFPASQRNLNNSFRSHDNSYRDPEPYSNQLNQRPSSRVSDYRNNHEDLGYNYQGQDNRGAPYQDLDTSYQSNKPGYQGPYQDYQGPSHQGHEPAYQGHEPSYQGHEPSYQGHEPSYQGRDPSYLLHEPSYQGHDLSFRGPGSDFRGPTYQGQEPSYNAPRLAQQTSLPPAMTYQGVPGDRWSDEGTLSAGRPEQINPLDERFSEQDDASVIAAVGGGRGANPPESFYPQEERYRYADAGSPPPGSLEDQMGGRMRAPSVASQMDSKWRNPDLREVIDFLSHQNDAIKANAAAYLQHLCYMDDNIKAQTRALRGIPVLVELLDSPVPEVYRAACGALRNLSYGRANDENKREIARCGCAAVLARLIRKTEATDVREAATGILWNLSSCTEVKKAVIDEAGKTLVDCIVIPVSGWNRIHGTTQANPTSQHTSTVFRNASGVLRNISSFDAYARTRLRECEGLIDSVLAVVRQAVRAGDMDNKSIENCACVLRNLSYACQEVIDPNYVERRKEAAQGDGVDAGGSSGCWGGKKKGGVKAEKGGKDRTDTLVPQKSDPPRGMELLWHTSIIPTYLQLLDECSNPETLEAAAGAIQNLAACDWPPAAEIRAAVRKEKGLSIIVDLLSLGAERVVCAAATALRNLALDERNKELIGKYAMQKLVDKLPSPQRPGELTLSNETISAVEATLYEVIKSSSTFAKSLMNEGGVERLIHITRSPLGIYSDKVVKFAAQLLRKMWRYSEFHDEYKKRGWKQADFTAASTTTLRSQPSSAENTINRARMSYSAPTGPGFNENTARVDRRGVERTYMEGLAPPPYSTEDRVAGRGGDSRRASMVSNRVQPPTAAQPQRMHGVVPTPPVYEVGGPPVYETQRASFRTAPNRQSPYLQGREDDLHQRGGDAYPGGNQAYPGDNNAFPRGGDAYPSGNVAYDEGDAYRRGNDSYRLDPRDAYNMAGNNAYGVGNEAYRGSTDSFTANNGVNDIHGYPRGNDAYSRGNEAGYDGARGSELYSSARRGNEAGYDGARGSEPYSSTRRDTGYDGARGSESYSSARRGNDAAYSGGMGNEPVYRVDDVGYRAGPDIVYRQPGSDGARDSFNDLSYQMNDMSLRPATEREPLYAHVSKRNHPYQDDLRIDPGSDNGAMHDADSWV